MKTGIQAKTTSGDELIDHFRSAFVAYSTAEFAKQEADRSEQETVQGLDEISRGTYLNPTFIPEATQNAIARASVDAHIKKVQASQISQQSHVQLYELQEEANSHYLNKKVVVSVLDRQAKPIESVWYDPNTGQYYPGILDTRGVSGTIQEIMLDKNALAIKPSFFSNIGSGNRKLFVAYIINPQTLEPYVKLQF